LILAGIACVALEPILGATAADEEGGLSMNSIPSWRVELGEDRTPMLEGKYAGACVG